MSTAVKVLCAVVAITSAVTTSVLVTPYITKRNLCPHHAAVINPSMATEDKRPYEDENPNEFECPICFDYFSKSSVNPFFKCKHLICEECLWHILDTCQKGWDDVRSNEAQGIPGEDTVHVCPELKCPLCQALMA